MYEKEQFTLTQREILAEAGNIMKDKLCKSENLDLASKHVRALYYLLAIQTYKTTHKPTWKRTLDEVGHRRVMYHIRNTHGSRVTRIMMIKTDDQLRTVVRHCFRPLLPREFAKLYFYSSIFSEYMSCNADIRLDDHMSIEDAPAVQYCNFSVLSYIRIWALAESVLVHMDKNYIVLFQRSIKLHTPSENLYRQNGRNVSAETCNSSQQSHVHYVSGRTEPP